jgi:predicted DNA binding CopG/RHH family protein
MGRPRTHAATKDISIVLENGDYEAIKQIADKKGLSVSAYIRMLVRQSLEE